VLPFDPERGMEKSGLGLSPLSPSWKGHSLDAYGSRRDIHGNRWTVDSIHLLLRGWLQRSPQEAIRGYFGNPASSTAGLGRSHPLISVWCGREFLTRRLLDSSASFRGELEAAPALH
jgi:hypothetical protein